MAQLDKSKPRRETVTYIARPLPDAGFVRLPSILAVYSTSRSKLYNDIKAGIFPAPVKLGPRTSAWRVDQVREALARLGVSV
jgi:predicted DNA-binding transcriptional regulator AlpA